MHENYTQESKKAQQIQAAHFNGNYNKAHNDDCQNQ